MKRSGAYICILIFLVAPASIAQQYTARDLGTLVGDTSSQASAINVLGQVVGISENNQDQVHGFLWTPGAPMQNLGALPGGGSVTPHGINAFAQVAGTAINSAGYSHAFLWTQTAGMQDLGVLPGFDSSGANSINDFGAVAGYSYTAGNSCGNGFLWTQTGGMQDLGPVIGGTCSQAYGINLFGAVSGTGSGQGFLWTPSTGMQNLGTPSDAYSINDMGQIAGDSTLFSTCFQASIWNSTNGWQDLGVLPGGQCSSFNSINTFAYAVGYSDNPSNSLGRSAILWTQAGGMQDLNTVFKPRNGWLMTQASGINLLGKIVGVWQQIRGNGLHAILLAPTNPSPPVPKR